MIRLLKLAAGVLPTAREAVVLSLLLVSGSGLLLTMSYDAVTASHSVARWILSQPGLAWVRSVHFWSALVLTGSALGWGAASLRANGWRALAVRGWIAVAALVVAATYLVVSGFLLRGDMVAEHVRAALVRAFDRLPDLAGFVGTILWGRAPSTDLAYFSHAAVAALLAVVGVAFVWRGPRFRRGRMMLAAVLVVIVAGVVSPGVVPRNDGASVVAGIGAMRSGVLIRRSTLPVASVDRLTDGRPEGCIACHAEVVGLGAHDPKTVGCAACHGGDVLAADADDAHRGLIRIPGNIADARQTCGQSGCHESVVPRVERSIMTTFAGVVAVDRDVFGETAATKTGPPQVSSLGTSSADTHLRQLCASCHLGQVKADWGPNTETSRGGGCNACHLSYSGPAKAGLAAYSTDHPRSGEQRTPPTIHPSLTANVENSACFGCHSRSGRVSLNYEGWCETDSVSSPPPNPNPTPASMSTTRRLLDGRTLRREVPDIHQERGLDCIDCHTAAELMGKGTVVARKHEQQSVTCENCHTSRFNSAGPASCDDETRKLLELRNVKLSGRERLGLTLTGDPLPNVIVAATGNARLFRKATGDVRELKAPAGACARGRGHERLSCESCHTAWAPRCASCHTSYDRNAEAFDHLSQSWMKGAWEEKSGTVEALPPTLGVRDNPADPRHPNGIIETFAPGMILELDTGTNESRSGKTVFRRLYARVAPHTTRREARSCESCHSDPVALGYGKGLLRFTSNGRTGSWEFSPEHVLAVQDGLPADAWVGFMQPRAGMVSTRPDVRPFTVEEQRRILRVGACLTCHAPNSAVMRQALDDFATALDHRSDRCAVPVWP